MQATYWTFLFFLSIFPFSKQSDPEKRPGANTQKGEVLLNADMDPCGVLPHKEVKGLNLQSGSG